MASHANLEAVSALVDSILSQVNDLSMATLAALGFASFIALYFKGVGASLGLRQLMIYISFPFFIFSLILSYLAKGNISFMFHHFVTTGEFRYDPLIEILMFIQTGSFLFGVLCVVVFVIGASASEARQISKVFTR